MTKSADPSSSNSTSPVDAYPAASHLSARVVSPAGALHLGEPHIHGYAVHTDLVHHYSFADLLYLNLTGQLPDDATSVAFQTALFFAAPLNVGEAPPHAAILAQSAGCFPARVQSIAAIALAEQTRHLLQSHQSLLTWFAQHTSEQWPLAPPLPPHLSPFQATLDEERQTLHALRHALLPQVVPLLSEHYDLNFNAALFGLLDHCGLSELEQLASFFIHARLPTVLAEAFAAPHGRLDQYPLRLPRFEYVESPSDPAEPSLSEEL